MSDVTIKGSGIAPNIEWIKLRYGEAGWDTLCEHLDPEEVQQLNTLNPVMMYPISLLDHIMVALEQTQFPGDLVTADGVFREMGRHAASVGLSGIYSAFLKIASPVATFKRSGSMLEALYTNVTCETEVLEQASSGVKARITIHGLEVSYAAPRFAGFGEEAIERAGAKNLKIEEESWGAGIIKADPLVFHLTWNT